MTGSRRNFQYTDDTGAVFLFNADEGNIEAVNGTAADIEAGNSTRPGLPRSVKPRRLTYSSPNRTRNLRIIAVTQAIYNNPPAQITINLPGDDNELTLTAQTPEKRKLFPNIDTGLTDGDNP